jgi:hypothetical protein
MSANHSYLRTISSAAQICNHPLNTSPAKPLHSFPHTERFKESHPSFNCKAEYYNVNDKLFRSQRTCSLGKGSRYDFAKNGRRAPPPNTYYPKNQTIEASANRGFSFGVSRDSCPQMGIVPHLKSSGEKPGPGAYTPVLPQNNRIPTFHIRTVTTLGGASMVGPGQYDVPSSFQPNKMILNSKYRSISSIRFAAPGFQTTRDQSSKHSGLGGATDRQGNEIEKDKKYQINKNGVYFNSKYRNSLCRYFGRENREGFRPIQDVPGPGTYRAPSEFGLYESSATNTDNRQFR